MVSSSVPSPSRSIRHVIAWPVEWLIDQPSAVDSGEVPELCDAEKLQIRGPTGGVVVVVVAGTEVVVAEAGAGGAGWHAASSNGAPMTAQRTVVFLNNRIMVVKSLRV